LTGKAKLDVAKKAAYPVKISALPFGRWRCLKDCPFLLLLFWACPDFYRGGKQKKSRDVKQMLG
jgi:hypothetical protein